MLSFVLQQSTNAAYLEEDVVGVVENDEIQLTIDTKVDVAKLIATFTHNGHVVFVNTAVQESATTANDFSQQLIYTVEAENKERRQYTVKIDWREVDEEVAAHIPHFYIYTDNNMPINSKDDYRKGILRVKGGEVYEDFSAPTSVKGRGNSTWKLPKKPYRLKLDAKASLLGLPAEKDWILLANYIDPSLMCNAVAMKTGQLLQMPFTNHIIPVDVTVNGEYMGSYMFTEQKEVKESRINVGEGGWFIELDTYFDEEWKFKSKYFQLPVMIQYPELDKMSEAEAQPIFNEMRSDFNALEELIFAESFPNNNYLDYFDAEAFVNYLIVYTLTDNKEINSPKSTYIYKKKGGKYNMGPIWDFDWAFGYAIKPRKHFTHPTESLFVPGKSKGTAFFSRIAHDPAIQEIYKTKWVQFKAEKYPLLIEYLKDYAHTIRESHAQDQVRWEQGTDGVDEYLSELLNWLHERVAYMDGFVVGN